MASPRTERRPSVSKTPQIGGALPRVSWKTSLAVLVILGLTGWSGLGVGFDLLDLLSGAQPVQSFVSEMFPPDLSASTLQTTFTGVVETFQMAFLGALIGAVVAFPLAALGTREASTVGASRARRLALAVPYHAARLLTNVFRSVPDILWALVFVVALGLGPFPGMLALAVHSAGVLGKLYSETLEAVPERPVEALHETGASGFGAFIFGRMPQAMASVTSLSLYQWECNLRSATILGFVGAGGIGQEILVSMQLFDYPKVATLVGATIIVVLIVDRFSAALRSRLVN
ncbi:phosphonate ABC transporter, permease protein PhnE [Rubrobacter aplysinae]|uniref:phosphonate ABC transporter, permease protein PhnE n=1 Tax=Rubrobacter aplysinae TaxID=909625 RepID=UPI00064C43C2|nr:phosphonate ABC transporter, permease protein PhnE [Rubrobacter aplysinae]